MRNGVLIISPWQPLDYGLYFFPYLRAGIKIQYLDEITKKYDEIMKLISTQKT
jgi:hypothetical protein